MTSNNGFLKTHLLPVCVSLVITVLAFVLFPVSSIIFSDHKSKDPLTFKEFNARYFPNFRNSIIAESEFQTVLGDSSSIIFLGSSEFSVPKLDAVPYNFFTRKLKYPVLCIGHAGNQSLCMLSFLAANRSYIRRTKLVILVSPTWFMSTPARGTSLETFLEFNSDRFLTSVYKDTGLPANTRKHIYQYISRNIDNISSPSSIQKLIAFKYASGKNIFTRIFNSPFICYYKSLIRLDSSIRRGQNKKDVIEQLRNFNRLSKKGIRPILPEKIPWDSLYSSDIQAGLKLSNNNWGIDSNYYNQFVHGGKYSLLPVPFNYNREFQDFCALLDFLSSADCNPVFIIQPLNPYVYNELGELKPLMDSTENKIKSHHFACLNLFTTDTMNYTKGDLKDVMHLGNPGWIKVDRFVVENFSPVKSQEKYSN
jgi:D-alanine transfer protein